MNRSQFCCSVLLNLPGCREYTASTGNCSCFARYFVFVYKPCKTSWTFGVGVTHTLLVATLSCEQNGCHFTDDIFKWNFVNGNCCILIEIRLKFVTEGPIENMSALVQIMTWCPQATSHYLNKWWARSITSYGNTEPHQVNLLAAGRCSIYFKRKIFKLTIQNSSLDTRFEIALRQMPQNLTNDESTLVQIMACCLQATSHYLSQCWPRSFFPYGIIRPRTVKLRRHLWNVR